MTRTLPPILDLAESIARELGGTAHMLWSGDYPSAAIALGDRHPLLLRDHSWTLTLSLPNEHTWHLATVEDLQNITPQVKAAIRASAHPVSMSDAVLALAPVLEKKTGSVWSVSFPGTPVPQEAWLKDGARSVGLFQEANAVRIVVWVGSSMQSKTVKDPAKLAGLVEWLETQVDRQQGALEAEEVEAKRLAALPVPTFEDVMMALKVGIRIRTGGGRYSSTYFLDEGVLRQDIFDEGESYVSDATEEQLRTSIRLYPEVFRQALRM